MNRFIFLLVLLLSGSNTLKAEANETAQPAANSQSSKGSKTILIPRLITHPMLKDLTVQSKQLRADTSSRKSIGKVVPGKNTPSSKPIDKIAPGKNAIRRYSPKEVGDFDAPPRVRDFKDLHQGQTKVRGHLIKN